MSRAPFLTAHWSALLMLSWEVPREALAPFVPRGTELDDLDGRVFASMVGFRFTQTRLRGLPIPFHQDFEEVNLRFYVRRRLDDGSWRRAAVFVSEFVPKPAIAWTARLLYNEPYEWGAMSHRVTPGLSEVEYRWRWRGRWHRLAAVTDGEMSAPAEGTLDRFISEHYFGYSRQRDGGTMEYEVAHPVWRLRAVHDWTFDADVAAIYGAAFSGPLAEEPASAFVAEGSDVAVYPGVRTA
jgi:uncharacterized protein YqjF (DUF2071 family)